MTMHSYYMQQGGQRAQMEPAKAKACFFRMRALEMKRHHQRIMTWQSFFEGSPRIKA